MMHAGVRELRNPGRRVSCAVVIPACSVASCILRVPVKFTESSGTESSAGASMQSRVGM